MPAGDHLPVLYPLTVTLLDRPYFLKPSHVAGLAGEVCLEKSLHQFSRNLDADHPRAEHKYIHIIVFHALVCRIFVMAQPGADAGNLVCCNAGSDPASADEHTPIRRSVQHLPGDDLGVVRVVDRVFGVSSGVVNLMAKVADMLCQKRLQVDTGVIAGNNDFHKTLE
jgi:hypothetical protein